MSMVRLFVYHEDSAARDALEQLTTAGELRASVIRSFAARAARP